MGKHKNKKWDRIPNEKMKNYAYFDKYLSLGPNRTLNKVHEKYPEDTPKIDRLKKISSRWNWVKRADAYDEYVVKKNQESRLRQVENFMSKEFPNAVNRQSYINENMMKLHEQSQSDGSATSISHALKSNASSYNSNLEAICRLAGIPSTITQNLNDTKMEAKVDNTVSITDEELFDEIDDLTAKILKHEEKEEG